MDYGKLALQKHKELKGKIALQPKDTADTREKLSIYYTPGVGTVSSYVADHPDEARDYTWINNTVAVVSDGSAVLGLGNIGPLGALPVMEGKAMLFKQFGKVDAVPIVLDVHSADEIVAAVKAIAPSFGGINLEDIAAPICFEVEERLKAELRIPVMHDDQHGTAIVTLAGLINAAKITGRNLRDSTIVLVGAGAAGVAIAKLIHLYAGTNIISIDSKGIISADRSGLTPEKQTLLSFNKNPQPGTLADAIKDAVGSLRCAATAQCVRNQVCVWHSGFAFLHEGQPKAEVFGLAASHHQQKAGLYLHYCIVQAYDHPTLNKSILC